MTATVILISRHFIQCICFGDLSAAGAVVGKRGSVLSGIFRIIHPPLVIVVGGGGAGPGIVDLGSSPERIIAVCGLEPVFACGGVEQAVSGNLTHIVCCIRGVGCPGNGFCGPVNDGLGDDLVPRTVH